MTNTPVLFLIFNRPDLTRRVFEKIRNAKPSQLFIAADGPRSDKPGENLLCDETRKLVLENIDWPCKINTLFREKNLGCKVAVSSAITWFFEHVEQGIILEDDCLPSESFFPYCDYLLEKYKDDLRVNFLSGTMLPGSANHLNDTYYFSKFSIIWGWATWRRVWINYDVKIAEWSHLSKSNWLINVFHGNAYYAGAFQRMFDAIYNGYDTWDFQLFFLNLRSNSLNIHPCINLIKNIGFDQRGTHTLAPTAYSNQDTGKITTIIDPQAMSFDHRADQVIFDALYAYDPNPNTIIKKCLRKYKAVSSRIFSK